MDLIQTGKAILNKPRFASVPVLDRICASTWDLNGSDPNW